MPKRLRFWLGIILVAISLILYFAVIKRTTVPQSRSVVHIIQQQSASSAPINRTAVPTDILISFPVEMKVDETRNVSFSARVINSSDYTFVGHYDLEKAGSFETDALPKAELENDMEIKLISSGFDIQGISSAKQGQPFPIIFKWTISPKKEGNHDLLIDLSQMIAPSSAYMVQMGGRQVELLDSAVLPLEIHVIGSFDVPPGVAAIIAAILAFFGAVILTPWFDRWLKRKFHLDT